MSEQPKIHEKTFSLVSAERITAAKQLGAFFKLFPDKKQASEDLLKLCSDRDNSVREEAINSLAIAFPNTSDKELVWDRLVNLTAYPDEKIMRAAVDALINTFPYLPDKNNGWKDLFELINSKSSFEDVSTSICRSLQYLIPELPDKQQVWEDLLRMMLSNDPYIREKATSSLSVVFLALENKEKAWNELMRLANDEDSIEIFADNVSKVFPYISNKEKVCSELAHLAEKKNNTILRRIVKNLTFTCPEICNEQEIYKGTVPEEKKATESIFELNSKRRDRKEYAENERVESIFRRDPKVTEKEEITEKLIALGAKPDSEVDENSLKALLTPYTQNSGKAQDIWKELLKKTEDRDASIRKKAAWMLSYVFPLTEEKTEVFFDLIKLVENQDSQVRKKAAELLTDAFLYSGDKERAWEELLKLESSGDKEVRKGAVLALSSGYSEVPDKIKAWKDLLRLSAHSDTFVQRAATRTLGHAFFYMPDKTQAWRDLQMLTENPYVYTRRYAFRSLGRASLWRALRAENEATYIFGLKEAVKYFKEAAETSVDANIPEFYQPFYEALLYILFSEREGIARTESERYLSKMRMLSGITEQPESRKLPEVFEQLAGLLNDAGNLKSGDLPAQIKLLETSISIFDKFSKVIENKEEAVLSRKTAKKEQLQPGKAILERVEKKKSFLRRKP